MLRYVTN